MGGSSPVFVGWTNVITVFAEPSFGPLYPLSLTEEKPPTELPVNIVGIEGNEDLFRRTRRELSSLSGIL